MLPKVFTAHFLAAVCALAVVAQSQSAQIGEAERAEALYRQSLDLSKNANHTRAHAKLLEAVNLWKKAHNIARATQELLQSGDRHKSEERWQYAIECFRRVLQLDSLSPGLKTSAFISLAHLYLDLRQFDLALAGFEESLKLAKSLQDCDAQAQSLTGLALVFAEQGKTGQALSYLDAARELGCTKKIEADALLLMSNIHYAQGRYNQSFEAMKRALDSYRAMGEREGESLTLCRLSNLLLEMGEKQDAFERAKEALALSSTTKSARPWREWITLARAQRALAQPKDALKSFYRAFGIIEKQAALVSGDTLKIGFMEERQAAYREMADLLIETGQNDEAFSIIEYARARSTLELLAGTKQPGPSPDSKKALQEISEKIAALNIELRSSGIDDRRRALLSAEIERLEQRQQALRIDTQMGSLKRFIRPFSLKQLQQEVLKPNESFLEFSLSEPRSHVWLVTAEKMLISSLPGRKDIDQAVTEYLSVVSTKPSNLYLNRDLATQKQKASRLFDTLLGAFKGQLPRGCSIIVAPDGPLHYLPFEALASDGHYLIEDHVISYMPSASVFGVLRQRPTRDGIYAKELLAFGDPVVSSKTGEFRIPHGARLSPLPNTRDEVLSISRLFPPDQSRIYLGRAMREETIKIENLRLYRRLHFATHSLIDERVSSRSAIVFALDGNSLEDGFLTADEVADLEIDCETVVLSACQTGRGPVLGGEGLIGLARSFLFAGARSVVVSLWNVTDASSSEFMKGFYRNLAAKAGGAESLRQAKLDLIAMGKAFEHPYYWAAFVLAGL